MCDSAALCVVGNELLDQALVEELPFAELFWRLAITDGTEIKNLGGTLAKRVQEYSEFSGATDLDICQTIPLHSRDASSFVKLDLPDTAEVGEEVLDAVTGLNVPHLHRFLTAGDDLAGIVLEAGDGSRMSRQRALALAILWIPDPERAVRGGRHEPLVTQVEKADEKAMAFQGVQASPRIEVPDLNQRVHGPRDATVALVIQDNRVYLLAVAMENMQLLPVLMRHTRTVLS